jgi:hypothetical protein
MATPTSSETRRHAKGAKKASIWGTAIALGAGDEILLEGASGLDVPEVVRTPHRESDTPYIKQSSLGNIMPQDVVLPVQMRYELGRLGSLIAAIFGTAGVPTQQGTTAAYKHIFQWADGIDGTFFTYAEERPSKIFEAPAVKPFRLELSIADGLLKAALSMRANDCIDDSSVNTATQMDALTVPSDFLNTEIGFQQLSVKINAESAGDVASETAKVVSDLNVVLERGIEAGQHVAGSNKIREPREPEYGGIGNIVTLSFPEMSSDNNAFFQSYKAGTTQKMLIKFTGALIESTYYYDFALYLPRLKPLKPNYTVEELVRGGLPLEMEQAASAPTGMDYTRVYAEIINKLTTDYLA